MNFNLCFIDNAFDTDFAPKEDTINALSRYLSELTFADGFGLRLLVGNVPDGFKLSYMRCSKRAVYVIKEGFTIILSKESSSQSNVTTNESRTSVWTLYENHFILLYYLRNPSSKSKTHTNS